MNSAPPAFLAQTEKKMWVHIYRADFARALAVIKKALKKYPEDFTLLHHLGVNMADAAEALPPKKKFALKKKGTAILLNLIRRSKGRQPAEALRIRCEYYFHSFQYFKLYKTGRERLRKTKLPSGNYSMGVGAAWHGLHLWRRGQKKRAAQWGKISRKEFLKYIKWKPKFYNTYIHLALALGLQGQFEEAHKALVKASKLSGKSMKHFEILEVQDLLKELLSSLRT